MNITQKKMHQSYKSAFTLMEMLISIAILSVMMVFLYGTLSSLQKSNKFYGNKLDTIRDSQAVSNTIFLDFSLVNPSNYEIIEESKAIDTVIMQTSHSNHNRFMPYVAYVEREGHLYRLESFEIIKIPLESDKDINVDDLGLVSKFKVYKTATHTLVYLRDEKDALSLIKIRILNE